MTSSGDAIGERVRLDRMERERSLIPRDDVRTGLGRVAVRKRRSLCAFADAEIAIPTCPFAALAGSRGLRQSDIYPGFRKFIL